MNESILFHTNKKTNDQKKKKHEEAESSYFNKHLFILMTLICLLKTMFRNSKSTQILSIDISAQNLPSYLHSYIVNI